MKSNKKVFGFLYLSRIYIALISFLLLPLIINQIGYEAYGLVGVFMVVQASLNILTAGVGGVLTRELVKSQTDKLAYSRTLQVVRKIVKVFLTISVFIVIVGVLLSLKFSTDFLKSTLDENTIIIATSSMFIIVAIKYLQGPYRSILLSSESHITISFLDALYATLVQPVALLILIYVNNDVIVYFFTQIVSILIVTILIFYFANKDKKETLAKLVEGKNLSNKVSNVKDIITFGIQLSGLSALWIIVSQSDKATLSSVMNLTEFSFYSVAFSVTALLTILNAPISQVLQPRLTKCIEDKQYDKYIDTFSNAVKGVVAVSIPLAVFMYYNGESLIYVWSGDLYLSEKVNIYLPWLFSGAVFATLSNFTFLIKYSIGDLKTHTRAYLIYSLIMIPSNIYIASNYLGEGMALFFFISNAVFYFIWSGLVFSNHIKRGYLVNMILIIPVIMISSVYFHMVQFVGFNCDERILLFIILFLKGVICVFINYKYIEYAHSRIRLEFVG